MAVRKKIKNLILRFKVFFADQKDLAEIYSKALGIKMGKNVRISGKIFWGTEPYLIEIGDNVNLTQDIRFINHGALHIFRNEHPGINYFDKIRIGNNVIIGACSIILAGVTIGDNTIIGAGSVVSKSIGPNAVAAGSPARVIRSIDEYKAKIFPKCIIVTETDSEKRKQEILKKMNGKLLK